VPSGDSPDGSDEDHSPHETSNRFFIPLHGRSASRRPERASRPFHPKLGHYRVKRHIDSCKRNNY
jgi:hypothetical protein